MSVCSIMIHLQKPVLPVQLQVDGEFAEPVLWDERALVPQVEVTALQLIVFPKGRSDRQASSQPVIQELPDLGPVASLEHKDAASARQQPWLVSGAGRAEPPM